MFRESFILLGALFILSPAFAAGGSHPHPGWTWTALELKQIGELEKTLRPDERGFWTLSAKRYVAKSNLGPRFTVELGLFVEKLQGTFPKIFPLPPRSRGPAKLIVIAHATHAEFVANGGGEMRRAYLAPDWYAADGPRFYLHCFLGGKDAGPFPKRQLTTILHDGAHALLWERVGRGAKIPAFLDGGVAAYFQSWDLRRQKVSVAARRLRQDRSDGMFALRKYLQRNPQAKISLKTLLRAAPVTGPATGAVGQGQLAYLRPALGESLVDYLLVTATGRRQFAVIVTRLRDGRKELLTEAEISQLEPGWLAHIKKNLMDRPAWEWTGAEAEEIEALEKKVGCSCGRPARSCTAGGGCAHKFKVAGRHWLARSDISASFTAQLVKYMDLFTEHFPQVLKQDLVGFTGKPEIEVFAHSEGYQEKVVWRMNKAWLYAASEKERDFANFNHASLNHRAVTVLLRKLLGAKRLPAWLDRGLKWYYYYYWDLASFARRGQVRRRPSYGPILLRNLAAAGQRERLNLQYLTRLGSAKEWQGPKPESIAFHRALGRSFVDYLLAMKSGRERLRVMLERAARGQRELLGPEEILNLEPRWHDFLRLEWQVPVGKKKERK